MKTIRILHISDLHRGSDWKTEVVGDYKDKAVSSSFVASLTRTMEEDFIDAINNWQSEYGKIDVLVCTGDLGNRGVESRIEEGMAFIKDIQESLSIDNDHVLVCPGNHDMNRKASNPKEVCSAYCKALSKYGFKDYGNEGTPIEIDGFPFVVMNTCLGANEKSVFIEKYNDLIKTLTDDDRRRFDEEMERHGLKDMDDCLDIPAVTFSQRQRVASAIRSTKKDFAIVLSHHSILPYNSVEVRPYYSVIDAGKTLYDLFETKKNILVLHGHIHFSSSLVVYETRMKTKRFVSSIGAGLFNGGEGSTVNIIEVLRSDLGEHIITKVFEYAKSLNGFSLIKSYSIYERVKPGMSAIISRVFDKKKVEKMFLKDLLSECDEREKDILITVLTQEDSFRIDMCDDDYCNWIINYFA